MISIAKTYIEESYNPCMLIEENSKEPSKKAQKKEFGEDDSDVEPEGNELVDYLELKVARYDNILEFWKAHANRFPNLCEVAMKILSKSASSSLSEKAFSIAGKINRPDRAHFKPENLPLLLILSYAKKFI